MPRLRPYAQYVASTAATLTVALVLVLRWMSPFEGIPSLWRPTLLFGTAPVLWNDAGVQPLALALALAICSTLLVTCGREEALRPRLTPLMLGLLGTGLAALLAANPITMIIAWAVYDLLQAAGLIAAGSSMSTTVRSLVSGGLATLLLWGGTLLTDGGGGSTLWWLTTPRGAQFGLWATAAAVRLWVYPFHLSKPENLGSTPSLAMLLVGPVTGWGLLLRLVVANGGALPGGPWMVSLGALTLVIGSFLAWSSKSSEALLPWIGVATNGALLLASGLAGELAPAIVVAGGAAWALGLTLLFLGGGPERRAKWWRVPSLIGALALLGAPLTLAFVPQAALIGGLTQGGFPTRWGGTFFFGNLFLIPSLVRLLLSLTPAHPKGRWQLVVHWVGQGLPVLLLITAGVYPPLLVAGESCPTLGTLLAMPGLGGWLLWAASLSGGGLLAWHDTNVRLRMELLLRTAHDLFRLEWLYGALVGALDRGLSVLRAADEVVGGAGALLWSLLLALLILLVWGSV